MLTPTNARRRRRLAGSLVLVLAAACAAAAQRPKPRARDLGVPFDGTPGPLDAITDVRGVTVGQTTLIEGEGGPRKVGVGPVRTGVTAILPRGRETKDTPVFAGCFALNGNGEMTGTAWVEESGVLEGPVMLTNTHSVGVVRDATIAWRVAQGAPDASGYWWSLPVVAETWDGDLNDINGFHVKQSHVWAALDNAKSGPVAEGDVGGGTGMICHEFKGGIGTASRKLSDKAGGYTVGALVQANYGLRYQLRIAGVPVGQEIPLEGTSAKSEPNAGDEHGSIIVVIATDAPLLPHQLKRVARRASLALGRMGSVSGTGSGDIFIAFTTASVGAGNGSGVAQVSAMGNDDMSPLFEGAVQATEEAIVNALVAAETMTGADGLTVPALPHDKLREILREYNRLAEPKR